MQKKTFYALPAMLLVLTLVFVAPSVFAKNNVPKGNSFGWNGDQGHSVQLGPRPYYLVEDMDESPLKSALQKCSEGPFKRTDFSIGHRGAGLQFPEHTKESYIAAARMGAGIVECDVTFTADRELVCRHSQCDLHTTTNILSIPELAAKCSEPFSRAEFGAEGNLFKPASARCCTSDITLEEFKIVVRQDGRLQSVCYYC